MVRQAVVLCGGLGSRLGALAADMPKPLLPVDGTPFLDVLLYELARQGVTRVLLLAGFAAQRVVDYAASTPLKSRFGLEIEVSIEPQRAGTGGEMPPRCDLCLRAPSDSTPLIQQIHITAGHIICGLVEERLFSRG